MKVSIYYSIMFFMYKSNFVMSLIDLIIDNQL
jgi:hypothetical protein